MRFNAKNQGFNEVDGSRREVLSRGLGAAIALASGLNPLVNANAVGLPHNDNNFPSWTPPSGAGSALSWPREDRSQDAIRAFYGDPRGNDGHASPLWERRNLVRIQSPFQMTFAGRRVPSFQIHKNCEESLERVLANIWAHANHDQATIDRWGASIFGGTYVFRLKRTSASLSMHAYGCAIDLDPGRNSLGDLSPSFTLDHPVVRAFEEEGWTWGGHWKGRSIDAMHFQATLRSR